MFEKEEDLKDPAIWRTLGGSENPRSQERYRNAVLLIADYIIPGHGPMFSVTASVREEANKKSTLSTGQANYLPPSFVKSGFSFPVITGYSDAMYGTKWVDDVSTKMDKFDLIGSSRLSPRPWEDKLKDPDISKRDYSKPDLFHGQGHLGSKSLYDSGSRSLDARINFDDRARSPLLRENRTSKLDDYNAQAARKYTSETTLCAGNSLGILRSKSDRDSDRSPINSSTRNFDSTKSDLYGVGSHGLEKSTRFDRSYVDTDVKSVGFGDYKSEQKYGSGRDLSFKESDKTGLKVSFGSNDKYDSKDKLFGTEKSGSNFTYNQSFSSVKHDDRFSQEVKLDRFKVKHDLKGYNSDKFKDEGKSDKFKWDSRDSAFRDWGSLERQSVSTGEKFAEDSKAKETGDTRIPIFSDPLLKTNTAHGTTDSLVQRDDRFSRVII